ncbi:GDP-mannose 4,6 dehydratase [Verrucomicrobiaceae bacterium SCGC AG-212-N21]|nr:GDP-mannose 4,6 dehydratase [Verrucomicrobiaceae bacterium SCGC AG-212-N21]
MTASQVIAHNGKCALITGITGQDGSYLTELLLDKGYEVHGIVRRASMFNRSRIEALRANPGLYGQRFFLHYADLSDSTTLRRLLRRIKPHELYHLAGQSHVGLSFEIPESTCQETAGATLSLLEICRDLDAPPRIYHASSSEVFGSPLVSPQTEDTPFRPVSPYGCAKAFATDLCRVYRDAHKLFVCSGIAYNHESPRRGENFVTRKITAAVARIAAGADEILELGNLDAARDWGWAPEYVEAMWRMLQQETADDYILATGTTTTVREFAVAAFAAAGVHLIFERKETSDHETARDRLSGAVRVKTDAKYLRFAEPLRLVGRPSKANQRLSWKAVLSGPLVAQAMVRAEAGLRG